MLRANLNALAMETMGRNAGSAAALIGSFTTIMGTGIGYLIAQQFDGTLVPLAVGYLGMASSALLVVVLTNRVAVRLGQPLAAGSRPAP